ncbi:MAG: PepSY domain-containing protein [Propionibacteriaceae bacterium]|nr:PepSY domain-containing protein [Propionibacteriaceae bacterium]
MRHTARKIAASIAAGLLALTVAACSSDETKPEETAPSAPTQPAEPAQPSAPPAATTTAAAEPGQTADARNKAALQAISTAADAAKGTPFEIDAEDDEGAWEVHVMVDTRTHEVEVSADGRTVTKQEDEEADRDDTRRLGQAGLSLSHAIEAALREVPGTLDDVELADDNDIAVWEVTIDTPDADDVEVLIDVRDGRVVRVDR